MACGCVESVSAQGRERGRRGPAAPPRRTAFSAGGLLAFLIVLLAALPGTPRPACADPIKANVVAGTSGGYARLIFSMSDFNDVSVRQTGNVLIISFKTPVDISVDRLAAQASGYIGAARRDPDGMAVRLALARKVSVNAMAVGQQYYVDLLPDTWQGLPPGLPQDVVDDLTRRARDAEVALERAHRLASLGKVPPVRVHVATQPTFTRYVFDIPKQISVSAHRATNGLTLTFDAPVNFDLSDVLTALPATVGAVKAQISDGAATVRFDLPAKVDVRSFRDENGYAVDIVDPEAKADADKKTLRIVLPEGRTPAIAPGDVSKPPLPPATAAGANGAGAKAATPTQQSPIGAHSENPPPAKSAAIAPSMAPSVPVMPVSPKAMTAPTSPPTKVATTPAPTPVAKPLPGEAQQPAAPAAAAAPVTPSSPPAAKTAAAPAASPAPSQSPAPAAGQPGHPTQAGAAPGTTKSGPAAKAPPPAIKPATAAQTPRPHPNKAGEPGGKIAVELERNNENLKLTFDFSTATAAAVFNRADTLWLVFDSKTDIDLAALKEEATHTIRSAELTRAPDADIVRIKLDRPRLASVGADGPAWTLEIGDSVEAPIHALDLNRSLIGTNRSTMSIPLEALHELHRITDPEARDQILVVTAFPPVRGVIHKQSFIEFRALATQQGVAIEPLADDLNMGLTPGKIIISRPGGLTLSSSLQSLLRGSGLHPMTFDPQLWGFDRKGSYEARQSQLIAAAAAAPETKRLAPRLDLARFYLARSMYAEAKGVLDLVMAQQRPDTEDVTAHVLRAVAEVMMDRADGALKDLSDPSVGDQHDAALWRALAYARQGKWGQAHESFKSVDSAIATLPIELQRFALKEELRSSIEVGDFASAENELNDLQTIGIPEDLQPQISVLVGRLDQGLGRPEDALAAYRSAADSPDRPAAAQGRLRETALRYSLGDLKRDEVISDLESLTTVWRGDETEIEALQMLARLYTEEHRYRDSFYVMRSAMAAHPDWDMTRRIQEEAAKTFDALFLAGKGDAMAPIDALSLFYDFRELTPIGNRGDEMIRRLADRLVSVDLLDQAAGLLQYQVDKRLQGAARSEVATRLAVIYLMNRKPDKALAVLRASRSGNLSTELRDERLLLEARALSDLGRHALAIEVAADVKGTQASRLRSDVYWAAHKWRKSAEQIELMYGDRWKQWQPLTDVERSDILRAEIGYALADDKLGIQRFRDRYAPKMASTPDASAFEVVSAPLGSAGEDFKAIARAAAASDTLDDFLRDMKTRYPESNPISSGPPDYAPEATAMPGAPAVTPSAAGSAVGKAAAPLVSAPPQTRPAVPPTPPAPGVSSAPATTSSSDGQTALR
jgi:tetratricopeptide (TPR) repeat protein